MSHPSSSGSGAGSATGLSARQREILERLASWRSADAPTHGGRVLSYVYDSADPSVDLLADEAVRAALPVNALDPLTFTSVAKMERDLVAVGREVFHGPEAVGTVTSGGTESCLLAVTSARDEARQRRDLPPGAGTVVLPTTAHPAFLKAAGILDLNVCRVSVDPATTAVHADRIAAALDEVDASGQTPVLVVASAPNYPGGSVDPVPDIAAVTRDRGVALHVDACLGGFVLPWWPGRREVPGPWDFRVPGVRSISADTHKHGYAPKGSSLLLYAEPAPHRAQYFATADWPGYPIVNPTLLGTRPAAPIAAAWAVTQDLHPDGYERLTRSIAGSTDHLLDVVGSIEGLRVVGEPTGPVFAVGRDDDAGSGRGVDPHAWAEAVGRRGFALQMQPAYRQPDGTVLPASTHLTITPATAGVRDELASALVESADEVRGVDRDGEVDIADLMSASDDDGPGLDMVAVLRALETLDPDDARVLLAEFLADYTTPS